MAMGKHERLAPDMNRRVLLSLSLLIIFLTGCLPTYIIDDIRLVQAIGYDAYGHDRIVGTIAATNYNSAGNPQSQSQSPPSATDSFSVISNTGKTVPFKLQAKSQMPLRLGKLQVILFNKELAKRGIEQFIDFFNRDPDIGRQLYLAVIDGSSKTLLSSQYATGTSVSDYINKMIEQNADRNLPRTNLHAFLYAYFGNGIDPFLPLLKKSGDHIVLEGIAFFKTNKMVAEIPFNQSFIFKMMYQPFTQGNYEIRVASHDYVSVENIGSTVDYKIKNGASSHPVITISVNIKGVIREGESRKKSTKYSRKVTKIMEKELSKKANMMVDQFQKKNIDPLGLGDRVRSNSREWEFKKWLKAYPHADINVRVNMNIAQTGITS